MLSGIMNWNFALTIVALGIQQLAIHRGQGNGPLGKYMSKRLTRFGWLIGRMVGMLGIFLYCCFYGHWTTYWIYVIIIYGDDLLADDDDKWKKRWQKAKNKIKWQWLPEMEPQPIRIPIS